MRPTALWNRLRRLQKLPDPLLHPDPDEREKSKAEWRREAPEIVADLLDVVSTALREPEARAVFESALEQQRPRYRRPGAAARKQLALDVYDAIEARGETPKPQIAAQVAERLKPLWPPTNKGSTATVSSIPTEVRRFVRERGGNG